MRWPSATARIPTKSIFILTHKKRQIAPPVRLFRIIGALATLLVWTVACAPSPGFAPGSSTPLTELEQAEVRVAVLLERGQAGDFVLAATFTPLRPGFHLYSKDIPETGINHVGRPTRLSLPEDSPLQASGPLSASLPPQTPSVDPRELLVYPPGPVTLRLPVQLPAGDQPQTVEIRISYMSCNGKTCLRPVLQKPVSIQIPGAGQIPPVEASP